jgi:gamma-glutamyltranspeptidase/glutathione hydrolase/leukotriene-C4 hydrolase
MTPIIILNKEDEAKLILGASGGSRILTGVSQVAIKTLYMNKNIKEAIDEKRIHHQLYPKNVAEVEQGFSEVYI